MATASLILNLIIHSDPANVSSMAATGLALNAVTAGVLAVGAGMVAAVGTAADFDLTMRQTAAALQVSGEAMKDLRDLALDMGTQTSFSAQEAGSAMLALAKGGMTEADIKGGALQQTLVLAAAGSLALGDAANYMVQGLNTFGLQAGDAAEVAAALAGGANASTASVESLGLALSQVGPGAKNAGLSLQETVGILAAFANAGIQGSDAGTSLKTMLTRLVPTTKESAEAMADLGLKFTDANGAFLPMRDVAQQLQDKLAGLTEEQRSQALATIFGSDATRAATVLMDLGAAGVDKFTAATSDLAAAQNMAAVNTSGAAGSFEKFKGAVETLGLKIGTALLPAVQSITDAATRLVNSLGGIFDHLGESFSTGGLKSLGDQLAAIFDSLAHVAQDSVIPILKDLADLADPLLVDAFGALLLVWRAVADVMEHVIGPAVRTVTDFLADHETIVGAVVIVIGTFAGILGTVSLAISGAVTAFWAISSAIAAVRAAFLALQLMFAANPLGLALVAIAALAAGLIYAYQHSETFRDIVQGAFRVVEQVISATWDALKSAFDWVKDHWQELAILLTGPFGAAFLLIRSQIDNIKGALSGIWDGITNGAGTVLDKIIGVFTGIAGAIRSGINQVLATIGNPFAQLFDMWIGGIGGVGDMAVELFEMVFGKFQAAVNKLIDLWNSVPILPDLPHIDVPFLASGGNITSGGMAIVGEAGPEMLELPTGARVTPLGAAGGGGTQEIHLHTHVDFTGVGMDALITSLREGIKVRGGDPQTVLGSV